MRRRTCERFLSLVLTVLMLVCSLPTAALELPPTTMEATDEASVAESAATLTETQNDDRKETEARHYAWKEGASASRSATRDGYMTEYNYLPIDSDIVPDGVYAIRNWAQENDYIDLPNGSAEAGTLLQQRTCYTSPAIDFARRSLFKITRYFDTEYYIIRPMTNNYLSIENIWGTGTDMNHVRTRDISPWDETVSTEEMFTITHSDDYGYIIRPYTTTMALGSNATPAAGSNVKYITMQHVTNSTRNAVTWTLEKYDDVEQAGVDMIEPVTLTVGNTVDFAATHPWSTEPDAEYVILNVDSADSAVATGNWNYGNNSCQVSLHDEGTFRLSVHFTNINEDTRISYYTGSYTAVLLIQEGTYFFQNKRLGTYMTVYDPSTPNQSANGAALLVDSFEGEPYQKFILEHIEDGYYKIKTSCGKVVSLHQDYTNAQRYLWQAFYLGESYQQWKFEKTARGSYIIRLKSAESYATDWCMGASDTPGSVGLNVLQQAYTDDTDYKDEWTLIPLDDYSMIFCGIPGSDTDDGTVDAHDHTSGLIDARCKLFLDGYNNIQLISSALSVETFRSYLNEANVIVTRSHAGIVVANTGTYISLNDEIIDGYAKRFYSYGRLIGDSPIGIEEEDFYGNLQLVLFIGCNTGYGGVDANNLPSAITAKGANTAIGVNGTIYCSDANNWVETFFNKLLEGKTVQQASNLASAVLRPVLQDSHSNPKSGDGLTGVVPTIVICGNGSYHLGQ